MPDTSLDLRYTYTVHNLFTAIVEHPGWSSPKVRDVLALTPQDVVDTVRAAYGDAAVVALINPAAVLIQAVVDMPAHNPVTGALFWTASRQGAAQWTLAADRAHAARTHQQQTGQAANLVLPADDLVQEALRLNRLLERNDPALLVSDALVLDQAEA